MSHECGCQSHSSATAQAVGAPITADLTVGDVTQRYAGALDTMKEMGINHCCGANLTLREAAASAGVALDVLLAALDRPAAATSRA
jgi:iron-sulfur cluster repair protein YtfE (RIC family)